MKWPFQRSLALALIVVGVVPFIYSTLRIYSGEWEVLTEPVSITPGRFESREFSARSNRRYLISLRLNPLPNLLHEQCEMGIAQETQCGTTSRTLDFDWQVSSKNGNVVGGGPYRVVAFGTSGVTFGEFRTISRDHYRVVLNFKTDGADLNAGHPTLAIEAGGEYTEGLADFADLAVLWAACVGGSGLLLLGAPPLAKWLRMRRTV